MYFYSVIQPLLLSALLLRSHVNVKFIIPKHSKISVTSFFQKSSQHILFVTAHLFPYALANNSTLILFNNLGAKYINHLLTYFRY